MESSLEAIFDLWSTRLGVMINYNLFSKLNLIGNCEFIDLTIFPLVVAKIL